MHQSELWKQLTQSTSNPFGTLSIPPLQILEPTTDCSPQKLLSSAGVRSMSHLIERRENTDPIELGSIDDDGHYDPFRSRLRTVVQDFFVGESIYLERHTGQEHLARRPPQHFDVRKVGSCKFGAIGDTVEVFCCRYGETGDHQEPEYSLDWTHRDEHLHPRSIQLAIPSRAGLRAPEAVSLVHPLRMQAREYIPEGEAGAVFAGSVALPGFSAELYWDEVAFRASLNHVQEIGRWLIERNALARTVLRGTGEVELGGASAIVAKLYEAAAQYGQAQPSPFFPSGIWGLAVFPNGEGSYMCQLGVVGLEVDIEECIQAEGIVGSKTRCMALLNLILTRDEFGFLHITPDKYKRLPLNDIPWHSQLPNL